MNSLQLSLRVCNIFLVFLNFFLHFFHGLYIYFLFSKKFLVDNQLCFSRFCPIKSSFNDISYLDINKPYVTYNPYFNLFQQLHLNCYIVHVHQHSWSRGGPGGVMGIAEVVFTAQWAGAVEVGVWVPLPDPHIPHLLLPVIGIFEVRSNYRKYFHINEGYQKG